MDIIGDKPLHIVGTGANRSPRLSYMSLELLELAVLFICVRKSVDTSLLYQQFSKHFNFLNFFLHHFFNEHNPSFIVI